VRCLQLIEHRLESMRSRLLIVDDNPQFLDAAKDLLERQGLDVVAVASTGADALCLAGEHRPDCILVDVDLGAESGIQLAELLGADHGPPVVLISAYSESEFADLIAASSAVGFISKSALSARRIAEVLDRAGPRPT
jgi:DNA-binding NarL/FixJ family response regulator